ncbi:ABC transporter substrate-binding protein [Aureimonas populi]|uniref:ABC transporter substrate-binding protein n=1 Tax=Aureimonas populi TaxID=1701758 RepID=A0ABW5CQE7_9HYPH|nr:ABC transporter substrate-binding protein [Aureimonas populi]
MTLAIRPLAPLAALLLASAAPAPLSAQEGGTVRAVMHSALRILDPIASSGTITRNHGYMVFDTLLGVDENLQPKPQMADWEVSEDGLTYSFTLREGLLWHDGAPVTAADCVASLKRWAQFDAGGRVMMAYVEAIEAEGDRQFSIRLSEPLGSVPDLLAKPSSVPAFMMPQRLAETPAGDTIAEQIGSGPFRFSDAEFQPGVQVVYEKFEDYVPRDEPPSGTAGGKVVNVDRVEWIAMPDAQTSLNALISGDIDYIERAPIDLLPILEAQEDISIEVLEPLGMQVGGRMNFLHPPFDNVEIRRAALMALGQPDVLAALIGDPRYYEVCGAIFGCGTPFASQTGARTLTEGGDVEAARAALEAAGYDGTPVVLLQPTDVATLAAQPMVAADALRRAGFEVRLEPMDWQTLVSRRASQGAPSEGGWNMFFTNANVDSLSNPIINMYLTATGTEGSWFGWPTDPELEALRIDFAMAQSEEARVAAAEAVQAHVMEQVIMVPLGQFKNVTAWGPALDGLIEGPVPAFWNLTKSE